MGQIWAISKPENVGAIDFVQRPEEDLKFDGQAFGTRWIPRECKWVDSDRDYEWDAVRRRDLDSPDYVSGVLVLKDEAWQRIEPSIGPEVEALEIAVENRPYVFVNVTNVVDCVNREESDLVVLSNGRVAGIRHYVFFYDRVVDKFLFKIPELPHNRIFATSRFKALVESLNVTGIMFREPNLCS